MYFNTLVDANTLANNLRDPRWLVFDCRFALAAPEQGRLEYESSHIPGARYADLDVRLASPKRQDSGRHPLPDASVFGEWLREQGLDQDSQVVAYDASGGMFAARLWWMLRWFGHQNVALLDGGWQAWLDGGHAVSAELPMLVRGDFNGQPDDSMWVSTPEVEAISTGEVPGVIVDARARSRFDGAQEPIDPVAGHIPGALNHPCTENVDDHGYFLTGEQIQVRLSEVLLDVDSSQIVNMCGSGVTACRNILAMEIAGWSGSRLYVGSWSEWITDPARPIATE